MSLAIAAILAAATLQTSPADRKALDEAAKKAVDEFAAKLKEAPGARERSRLTVEFGALMPRHDAHVAPLAKLILPAADDPALLVSAAAVEALARFRGSAAASRALMRTLDAVRRIPYLQARVVHALGRVGHPVAMPVFDEALSGADPAAAVAAVRAVAEMPGSLAVERLLAEYDRMETLKKKPNNPRQPVFDRAQPEIEAAVLKITRQPYPTFAEHRIWVTKNAAAFKSRTEEEERERAGGPGRAAPDMPPLLVEFLFREGEGPRAENSGASGVLHPSATLTGAKWSTYTPPNGGPFAVDLGRTPGPFALDLVAPRGMEVLKKLKSFTITGWVLRWEEKEAAGTPACPPGNRIVSWLNGDKIEGVEVVCRGDGTLAFGVNGWADASPAKTKPGSIGVWDFKEPDAGAVEYRTWAYFAITYDSTLPKNHAKIYRGWRQGDASLAVSVDYPAGPAGTYIAPAFTVGNLPPDLRPQAPDRAFRGVIDEIRVFGSPVDGSGALPIEEIVKLQNRGKG